MLPFVCNTAFAFLLYWFLRRTRNNKTSLLKTYKLKNTKTSTHSKHLRFIGFKGHVGGVKEEGGSVTVMPEAEADVTSQWRGVHDRYFFHVFGVATIFVSEQNENVDFRNATSYAQTLKVSSARVFHKNR